MSAARIITEHEPKPIPTRDMDWSAVRDGYEGGDSIGYGRTEQDAIGDLIEKEENRSAAPACPHGELAPCLCRACIDETGRSVAAFEAKHGRASVTALSHRFTGRNSEYARTHNVPNRTNGEESNE
jgi:hypothetical protein